MAKFKTKYGLPEDIVYCKKCVMSNQRPASAQEFKHTIKSKKTTMNIDENGICDACRVVEGKEQINWKERELQLQELCDKYRKNDGSYDCIVPGSGGKDSAFQSHILKTKYGMNPLTVTWAPIMYTDYGVDNYRSWLDIGGHDNISFYRNGKVLKLLTKLSIINLMHPFQTFIIGQKNIAPKIAAKYGISLIFYGENEADYGNPIADSSKSIMDKSYFSFSKMDDIYLGGVSIKELKESYGLDDRDLLPYMPIQPEEIKDKDIQVHYLGYYMKWVPEEVYYYACENSGYKARPFRSQGTYAKYNSIDDKIDDLHFYTTYIKFGIGRTTYDASQEVRNNHITRSDAINLVRKFDGQFPDRYFDEIMNYLDIESERFAGLCDEFRSPHLWVQENGVWKLRSPVWEQR